MPGMGGMSGMSGMSGGSVDPYDIFAQLFNDDDGFSGFGGLGGMRGMSNMGGLGGMSNLGKRGGRRRAGTEAKASSPREVVHKLPCTLNELYNGTTKKIKVTRNLQDGTGSSMPAAKVLEVDVQ